MYSLQKQCQRQAKFQGYDAEDVKAAQWGDVDSEDVDTEGARQALSLSTLVQTIHTGCCAIRCGCVK